MDKPLNHPLSEDGDDPIEMSVQAVKAYLETSSDPCLIDVREDFELEISKLSPSRQLTEALASDMLANWDKSQTLIFYCHHGGRSRAAAEYFQKQGFQKVRNMTGGIDAWSLEIDPTVPRY